MSRVAQAGPALGNLFEALDLTEFGTATAEKTTASAGFSAKPLLPSDRLRFLALVTWDETQSTARRKVRQGLDEEFLRDLQNLFRDRRLTPMTIESDTALFDY